MRLILKQRAKFNLQAGFTLIEVMVVVMIIAILAAVVVPRVMDRPEQAREIRAKQDIQSIQNAMDLYRLDNGSYPTQAQGIAALVSKPSAPPAPMNYAPGGYLKIKPVDPWGQPYHYDNPGKHGEIDVYTYGKDGTATGKTTIGSWNLQKSGK